MHPKFIAVLSHGLNLKPEKLSEIRRVLEDCGGHVVPIALMGHRGNMDEMRHVSLSIWIRELSTHCEYAQTLSNKHRIPLVFVGYSMGALLLELFLSKNLNFKVDQRIYFAPAFSFHWWTQLKFVLKIIPSQLIFKGLTPAPYNSCRGASIAAYKSLFRAADQLKIIGFRKLKSPVLIFADPKDELVNIKGIYRMIEEKNLDHWKLELVHSNLKREGRVYHHLIIDSNCLEKHEWIKVSSMMKSFIKTEGQTTNASL